MHQGIRERGAVVLLAVVASLALAACGSSNSSSSGDAASLLKQTFTGPHKISSGELNLAVTVDPSGSSTLSGPIKLSFGGPFENSSAITQTQYRHYTGSFSAALASEKRLRGSRRNELEAVVENLHNIAASGGLIPSRLPVTRCIATTRI